MYPELWASGVRGLYSLLARAIPGLAPVVADGAVAQAGYANAARNSLKDLFRGPAAPIFSGAGQPTLDASLARYGGDPYAVIAAAGRTNKAVDAAFAGAAAGSIAASPLPGGKEVTQGVRLECHRMAVDTKKWLVRGLQSVGISAVIWVIAWLWGGVNFAFGILAIAIVLGILSVLIT